MRVLKSQERREFLEFLGRSAWVAGLAGLTAACETIPKNDLSSLDLLPISPTSKDDLVLSPSLKYEVLMSWGDKLNGKGESFGFNNDYIALKYLTDNKAIMWVNHESVNPIFTSDWTLGEKKNKNHLLKERKLVGGSLIEISRKTKDSPWEFIKNSKYNRRIDGNTPIPFAAGVSVEGRQQALGTLSNCSGGVTSWGSFLSCEENYDDFYGETIYKNGRKEHKKAKSIFAWDRLDPRPPEHYGWVVEIDALTGKAKKHTSMGRFAHEGALVVEEPGKNCVVYMGDDSKSECIYKFISDSPQSLDRGELFVANVEQGQWISLSRKKQKVLRDKFKTDTECLIRTREAARLVGGSLMDRPEGIVRDPKTGAIYIALTNNADRNNHHGSILTRIYG